MLAKTISYTDYNGNAREEVFYFNLSKAELTEWDLRAPKGLKAMLQELAVSGDHEKIVDTFKEILFKSYGIPSEDGRRFIKSDKISEEFAQTEAYSELFMEITSGTEAMTAFINGIIPKVPNPDNVAALPVK